MTIDAPLPVIRAGLDEKAPPTIPWETSTRTNKEEA
jgi:hypothetical protein